MASGWVGSFDGFRRCGGGAGRFARALNGLGQDGLGGEGQLDLALGEALEDFHSSLVLLLLLWCPAP